MARGRSIFGCDYILDLTIETQVSSRPRVTSQLIAQPSRHQHLTPTPGSRRSPPCPGSGSADRPFHRRRRAAPSPLRPLARVVAAHALRVGEVGGPLGLALEPRVVECRRVVMVSVFYSILGLRTILVVNVIPIKIILPMCALTTVH